nr:orotate phosphoribosyltransferase [Candidatus Woesearchaeota archaeon]
MQEKVANILLKIKAITFNIKKPYKYASGILSPIYTDNRLLMSYPKERDKIIEFFINLIKEKNLQFDIIAGTATAGIPHAAWLSSKLNKPMIYVRNSEKKHGKQNQIEGVLKSSQKVLVIEDLISTGKSSIETINSIRNSGGIVNYCISIFTYNLKEASDNFKDNKCNLLFLCNLNALLKIAVKNKYLSNQDLNEVLEWSKDPKNWSDKKNASKK